MDIVFAIQDISNLNDYMTATHDVKAINVKPTINIATVLALKKIQSLEIEYLIKYEENGAACIVFERLLALPPSNIWGVLTLDLVNLIKYWLEAVRKHLIHHYAHWWTFLKLILKFIKEICRKDPSYPNKLVELISESLLNLATTPKTDISQRHEILHSLNMVCAESNREVRFTMRNKFGDYFAKLASTMLASSFFPFQYSALECLLRWLVPRDEPALRVAAADKWLPSHLCPETARNMFLDSNWLNFLTDARGFLNEVNNAGRQVTSLVCKHLSVGKLILIDGTDKRSYWVDLDTPGKSVSVMLEQRALVALGLIGHRAYEALVIDHDITDYVLLRRETLGLMMSLKLLRAPYIRPTDVKIEGEEHEVTIVVSSRSDFRTLDRAMSHIFGNKYRLLLDCGSDVPQSPQDYKIKSYNNSEEDTFSQPVEVKRQNRCGYAVRTSQAGRLVSLSSTSTSSLIQLRDKLTALPQFQFDKELVNVCAQPALSNVSEVTEKDDQSISSATTVKFQPWGVRSFKKLHENKSRSDSETVTKKSRGGRRVQSAVVSEDNNASLVSVATLGCKGSVINETIDQISKSKDFQCNNNIADLLVQQAFHGKPKSIEVSDSGINTDDKKSQEDSEAIENTPNEVKGIRSKVPFKKNCTVISKSTTDDESNTETINETPAFVYHRKNTLSRNISRTTVEAEKQPSAKTVEELFSQHVAEIKRGENVISSSKKINENSSQSIMYFEELKSKDIDRERAVSDEITVLSGMNNVGSNIDPNVIPGTNETVRSELPLEIQGANIKPKPAKKVKARVTKKTKHVKKNTKKMSTIVEQKEEDAFREDVNPETDNVIVIIRSPEKKNETTPANKKGSPSIKRKRKLYSPKDNVIDEEITQKDDNNDIDDIPLSELKTINNPKTPKSSAACYKELEKERKKYTHVTRSRKSNAKSIEMSPHTLKMNTMFDNLKQTDESNESFKLADKNTDVYNFTSSDDENFEIKKIALKPRTDAATVASIESNKATKTRNSRRTQVSASSYDEAKAVRNEKRKRKVTKRSNKQKPCVTVPHVKLIYAKVNLTDERMRESVRAEYNSSVLIERPIHLDPENIEPVLQECPQMEQIQDDEANDRLISKVNAKKMIGKKDDSESNDTLAFRVNKKYKIIPDIRDDSSSPLPGLVVEKSTPNYKDDFNDSLSTTMLMKFKKIYQECPKNVIDSVIMQSSTSDSIKPKSPVVSIAKISLEELNKRLLMPKMLVVDKNRDNDKSHKSTESEIKVHAVKLVDRKINIIDAKISKAVRERSNASILIANPIELEPEDIEPVFQEPPQMEQIENIESNDILVSQNNAKTTLIKRNYGSETNDTSASKTKVNKRAKNKDKTIPDIRNDSCSPLPGLLMEESMPNYKNDINNYLSTTMLHKCKRICQECPNNVTDSVITQSSTPDSIKSPVVSITRISLEEFNKWLPMPKTFEDDENDERVNLIDERMRKTVRERSNTSILIGNPIDLEPEYIEPDLQEPPQMEQIEDIESNDIIVSKNNPKNTPIELNYGSESDTSALTTKVNKRAEKTEIHLAVKEKVLNKNTKNNIISGDEDDSTSQQISTPESIKPKSPIVSISRMSFEEFNKWLPMPKHLEATDDITIRNTRSRSKLIHKDDIIDKVIDSNSDESETTKLRNKPKTREAELVSVESTPRKSLRSIQKSPVNPFDRFTCNFELNDSSDKDETSTRTKKYLFRSTTKSMKSVESVRAETPVHFMKRKSTSTSPILSGSKKRRLDHSSPRENGALQKILEKLDTTLVESNKNSIENFLTLLTEALEDQENEKEEHLNSYKQLAATATELHSGIKIINEGITIIKSGIAVLNKKYADFDSTMRENIAKMENVKTTSVKVKENLLKQIAEMVRADGQQQKTATEHTLKENLQDIMDRIYKNRRTDSS